MHTFCCAKLALVLQIFVAVFNYCRRSEVWKSFVFDKVWKADANQAEVFGDVEPMIVSVLGKR